MVIKKNAGFFIRFLSLIVDVMIFVIISVSLSLICIGQSQKSFGKDTVMIYQVNVIWAYYLWLNSLILFLIIQFLLIPIVFNGKTIGMLLTKLDFEITDKEKNIKKIVFKKFQLSAFLWILTIVFFEIFVSPVTINKMTYYSYIHKHINEFNGLKLSEQQEIIKNYKLNSLETSLITIPSTLSTVCIFFNLLTLLSIGIDRNKLGILDKVTNSKVVHKNKLIKISKIKIDLIKPEKVDKSIIEWKN